MSSNTDESDRSHRPTSRIIDAYEMNLEARRQYLKAKGSGEAAQDAAHTNLHQTAMTYFEALRYLLATTDNVSEYWEGDDVFLWSEQQYVRVDEDSELETTDDGTVVDKESGCLVDQQSGILVDPRAGSPVLEEVDVTGLQHLESWFDESRVERREISDVFGTRVVTEERPQRLAPDVLFRVCRGLDEAAKELGVLTKSEESVPRTEIDDDLMEELEEWRAENVPE